MEIRDRRIHIAGSAAREVPESLLRYAHELVTQLVHALGRAGATFVVGAGKEPLLDLEDNSSPSIIFDWTVLCTLYELLQDRQVTAAGPEGKLVSGRWHLPETLREFDLILQERQAVCFSREHLLADIFLAALR
jgi:hypothetical protein